MKSIQKNLKRPKRIEEIFNAHTVNDTDALQTNRNWTTMVPRCWRPRQRHHNAYFMRHIFPGIGNRPMNISASTMLVLFYTIVFVTLNYCVNDTVAFNLENRLPIVKYGDANTYFGYSVAGHMIEKDEDDDDDRGGGGGGSSSSAEKW